MKHKLYSAMALALLIGCGGDDDDNNNDQGGADAGTNNNNNSSDSGVCEPASDLSANCADGERASPWVCIRYGADCMTIEVQIEDGEAFVPLISVGELSAPELIEAARRGCEDGPTDWKKRIAEDLPAVFAAQCKSLSPGDMIDVVVNDPMAGAMTRQVAATSDKRSASQACWEAQDMCP